MRSYTKSELFCLFSYCLSIITFHLFCQCSTSLKLMLITGLPTGKRPSYNFVFGLLSRKTITQGREDKRSGTEKWCSQPLGMIHWTKIPTGLTGKSGPPQKVDHGPVFSKLLFPVGPNRSIEFWTEISRKFGWMDRAPCFIRFFLAWVFFVPPLWRSKFRIRIKKTLTKIWTLRISHTSSKLHPHRQELHNNQLDGNSSYYWQGLGTM